jgi:hypothetical protein
MKTKQYFFLILLLSWVFWNPDVDAQHKFEFGVSVEPLVIPANFGTYVETGPGFYDINGRRA